MGRAPAPFWLSLALLLVTLAVVKTLPDWREGQLRAPLGVFPSALGQWVEGTPDGWTPPELPPAASETLFRVYRSGRDSTVSLYLAYWKRQKPGEVAFTAKHAAPGREWGFVREEMARIPVRSRWRPELTVTRALYERGGQRQLVSYWYLQPERRTVAHRYWGHAYLLWDYLTGSRSDVVLIRIATPDSGSAPSFSLHEAFIGEAVPVLEGFFAR